MSFIKELERLKIRLSDIKLATNDFSVQNFIGVGGFGKVYKGELSNSKGRITVAVKRLDLESTSGQGRREFLTEIMMLSRYQHENLVSLLGFCDEDGERILVYEYSFHGSLDKHLANPSLTWHQRLRICCGAARGLLYLHDPHGGHHRVLHRDIKSSNILLDEKWEAKISDFGLSKIGLANQQFSILVSNAVGTLGYCDPLYIETGVLTKESDVYSFGVVLFEVLCGRLCIENCNDGRPFLVRLAQKSYKQNKLDDIIDDNMKEQMEPNSLATFSAIAYRCLRKDRDERPSMAEVVKGLETALNFQENRAANLQHMEGYHAGLLDPQSVLSMFKQYRLRVIAELSDGDLSRKGNIISCIELDRDNEFFATAEYSKQIKVFDFTKTVDEYLEVHFPVVEITSRKVRSLSWNKDTKNHLASSDYEGIVTVWDVNSQQSMMQYKEHEKRVRSVDFSCTEPSMLVSGGDDGKVKVWNIKQETSAINIVKTFPVCCVKYHPVSSTHVAVGSVDSCIYYYDLRNTSHPLHTFSGHREAVTYVKFLSSDELASASTDSTLRLWDLNRNLLVRTFKGHTNVSKFAGFSVHSDFMACGSETNEVFAYHKEISKPLTWHRFDSRDDYERDISPCVTAICWKSGCPTMIVGNNKGTVKVLTLET